MTVTSTMPATFAPAFRTTTALPGTAAEGSSDLGLALDSYTGAADTAGSEELIAQITFGGNFVSGARLDPAGDLVARAKKFAEGPSAQAAGLFLARAGLLAAEGATGAGAGAGFTLAAARSAALVGGGIFVAGDGDDESVGAPSTISPQGDMLTPFSEGQELESEGDKLSKDGEYAKAFGKFVEAAAKYKTARTAPAYARALFKKASSFEEAVRLRQIDPKGREPAAFYKDAADAYPEALGQSPELNSEKAGGLFVFARALERSGPKFKGEAIRTYEEAAGLFFALDDLAAAAAAIDNAQVLTAKRKDSAKVSLRVFKGDIHMAMGEYGIALDNYNEAARIGRSLTPVPDDAVVAEKMFVLAERMERVEGLEPLGSKGVEVFKSLAVESEYFRGLPQAEQIGAAKGIVKEWEAIRPDATEIGRAFIRAHSPDAKKGAALRHEGEQLMSEGRHKEAEEKFRLAAQKYHVSRSHRLEAESRHLQLEAMDAGKTRRGRIDRATVLNREIAAWRKAADEAGGLEKAQLLEHMAYAYIAGGIEKAKLLKHVAYVYSMAERVGSAAKVIGEAHRVNAREGDLGAEANAEMHENFGNLALENRQRLLAVDEFQIAAQENFGLRRFSKAARLYGRIGDLLSPYKSRYNDVVYYYELAEGAATKARDSDLVQTYLHKKIAVLLAMDRDVEAASAADELFKRSIRSDNRESALDRRNGIVKMLLRDYVQLPADYDWYLEAAWDVFSSLRGREDFSRLSSRKQWKSVVQTVGEWTGLSEEERGEFTDIGEFAVQKL